VKKQLFPLLLLSLTLATLSSCGEEDKGAKLEEAALRARLNELRNSAGQTSTVTVGSTVTTTNNTTTTVTQIQTVSSGSTATATTTNTSSTGTRE
jgi:transcription elongation GreA/GreB family factor